MKHMWMIKSLEVVQSCVTLEIETSCCEAGVPTCENDFHQQQQGGFYIIDLYVCQNIRFKIA
jgi:hypothetical protein